MTAEFRSRVSKSFLKKKIEKWHLRRRPIEINAPVIIRQNGRVEYHALAFRGVVIVSQRGGAAAQRGHVVNLNGVHQL